MFLLWDSSDMEVACTFVTPEHQETVRWQANRELARTMLDFLRSQLAQRGATLNNVKGIGAFRGPGSFTGLRIGLTVLNTWARTEHVPIIGASGEDWQQVCLERLNAGDDDQLVLPAYGSEAHTTKPRK